MVQWLGLCTSAARGQDSIPDRENQDPESHMMWPKKKKKISFYS